MPLAQPDRYVGTVQCVQQSASSGPAGLPLKYRPLLLLSIEIQGPYSGTCGVPDATYSREIIFLSFDSAR